MTALSGRTDGGRKMTERDEVVRPKVVIYDPELTVTIPAEITLTSAINAVAHAAEALYTHDGVTDYCDVSGEQHPVVRPGAAAGR